MTRANSGSDSPGIKKMGPLVSDCGGRPSADVITPQCDPGRWSWADPRRETCCACLQGRGSGTGRKGAESPARPLGTFSRSPSWPCSHPEPRRAAGGQVNPQTCPVLRGTSETREPGRRFRGSRGGRNWGTHPIPVPLAQRWLGEQGLGLLCIPHTLGLPVATHARGPGPGSLTKADEMTATHNRKAHGRLLHKIIYCHSEQPCRPAVRGSPGARHSPGGTVTTVTRWGPGVTWRGGCGSECDTRGAGEGRGRAGNLPEADGHALRTADPRHAPRGRAGRSRMWGVHRQGLQEEHRAPGHAQATRGPPCAPLTNNTGTMSHKHHK